VHVEDHPVEYFDFEGIIPKGAYGGGDVIVWDWGTWQPAETDDPARAIERGELHFDLHGEKLTGRGCDHRGTDRHRNPRTSSCDGDTKPDSASGGVPTSSTDT